MTPSFLPHPTRQNTKRKRIHFISQVSGLGRPKMICPQVNPYDRNAFTCHSLEVGQDQIEDSWNFEEHFCEPIDPCTWYKGRLLCPDLQQDVIDRKHNSFIIKFYDEIVRIVADGGSRPFILRKIIKLIESFGGAFDLVYEHHPHVRDFKEKEEMFMVRAVEGLILTVLLLAVLTLVTSKIGTPGWVTVGHRWRYGLFILNIWCDLIFTECPVDIKSVLSAKDPWTFIIHIYWILLLIVHHGLVALNIILMGHHFLLDVVLQRLVLASFYTNEFLHQICERSYDLCELLFDAMESVLDWSAKFCKFIIAKVLKCQVHMPSLKNLSQGKRQSYRCFLLMTCIAARNPRYISLGVYSLTFLFYSHFNTIVGNTQGDIHKLYQENFGIWDPLRIWD